jgi:hypothetical protein
VPSIPVVFLRHFFNGLLGLLQRFHLHGNDVAVSVSMKVLWALGTYQNNLAIGASQENASG